MSEPRDDDVRRALHELADRATRDLAPYTPGAARPGTGSSGAAGHRPSAGRTVLVAATALSVLVAGVVAVALARRPQSVGTTGSDPGASAAAPVGPVPSTSPAPPVPDIQPFVEVVRGAPYLNGAKRRPPESLVALGAKLPIVVQGTVVGVERRDGVPAADGSLLYGVDLILGPDRRTEGTEAAPARVFVPFLTTDAAGDLAGRDYPQLTAAIATAPIGASASVLADAGALVPHDTVSTALPAALFVCSTGDPEATVVAVDPLVAPVSGQATCRDLAAFAGS